MMKSVVGVGLAFFLASGWMQIAYADGSNSAKSTVNKPSPLNVQTHSSHANNSPVVHYSNPSAVGTKIYSSSCGSADTEVCSGVFVSTGRVVLSGEAPAYVESVAPIIHPVGTYRGTVAPMPSQAISAPPAQTQHHSHHNCNCGGGHQHGSQQIYLDGNMTGGVGAGVSSNWGGGRGGFASAQYPMVRSSDSVMYSSHSTYAPRYREYRVIKRHR